jgi:hypothetical protein
MEKLVLKRVGEHRMEGNLYKDSKGYYYVDCHNEPKNDGISVVYRLSPATDSEGEPDKMIECHIVIANPLSEREEREKALKFDYMMLSRMQMDCKYYDNAAQYNNAHWQTAKEMIESMKERWNKFPDDLKPEWITWEEILGYEKKFCA